MTGRVYLDWNATTPLRAEARVAMIAAMDVVGNPSSVHGEGRAALGIIERARAQVATAFGADGADVIFVSSATEGAALAMAGLKTPLFAADVEHDAVGAWADCSLTADQNGLVQLTDPALCTLQAANSETGVIQDLPQGVMLVDATQAFGKIPFSFNWSGAQMALISAHKLGGPKGIGALVVRRGTDIAAQIKGGGQEMGRRAGTQNVIGIAGFGAAAQAAAADLDAGVWDRVKEIRKILEIALAESEKETILIGNKVARLPNTSCFAVSGWKGETQVMQMDLAGFAVSAGSACSSGKVRASKVLTAMGYDDTIASCAIRVSIGPETTKEDVLRFAKTWGARRAKFKARIA